MIQAKSIFLRIFIPVLIAGVTVMNLDMKFYQDGRTGINIFNKDRLCRTLASTATAKSRRA
jgi:hypothetical protein